MFERGTVTRQAGRPSMRLTGLLRMIDHGQFGAVFHRSRDVRQEFNPSERIFLCEKLEISRHEKGFRREARRNPI
jgi:hypothetical protein